MPTNTSGGTTTSFMNTPQAVDDYRTAIEDGIYCFDVMSNDLGGNAKILWSIDDSNLTDDSTSGTYDLLTRDGTATSVPERSDLGALISIVDGVVKYDSNPIDSLAAGQTVCDKFTYAIRLSNGTLSWATVYITLTGTNDGVSIVPAGTTANGAVVEDSASTASPLDSNVASGTIAFDDPDLTDIHTAGFIADPGNTTTLGTFALGPVNEAANTSGGTVGWTYTINEAAAQSLAAGQVKTEKFVVTITDPSGQQATQVVTVTITGTNDGPVANADVASTGENASILVDVLANDTDVDNGAVLTVTTASAPAGQGTATVESNQVRFNPGTDFDHLAAGATANVVVSYSITDEHGATSNSTATITITGTNDGPVANADTAAGHENETLLIDVLANDTDVDDGAVLTVTAASAPAGQGSASVIGNQVQFNPGTDFDNLAAGATEVVTISYSIADEYGATSSSTVTVTVTGTNDGPVANVDTDAGHENETLLIDVLANDTDVDDGAVLTVTAATAPAGQGSASVVANQVHFDPGTDFDNLAAGATEVVTISYSIADEHGATSSSTVTVTVTGTNDGPVANIDTDAGDENEILLIDVLANDTDVDDGAILTVTAASAPAGQGSASVVGNQVQFDPGTDFDDLAVGETEVVTVSYTIADEHGATSSSTVQITVTGTNDGPVANPDSAAGHENQILTINVLANDTDVDNGAVLTVTAASVPAGQGSATVVANQVQFDPGTDFDNLAAGATEIVTISYSIADEHGATSSSTVTVTVTGTNDGPVPNVDTAAGLENETLLIDVLANDTDVDDGAILTVTTASTPVGQGSASVVGNQVQFDPGTDFDHLAVGATASVTISYTIEDEHGASSSSTVTVTVTGTNDGPVAVQDTASGTENQVLTVDVLANDTDVDDGYVLTLVSASAPSGQGSASVVGNQVRFDPGTDFDHLAAGATATVIVDYAIQDEHGAPSNSTLTITVTGTNDGPVANADTAAGHENETLLIDVLANDTDVDDGHVLTVTAASAPSGQGSASVVGNQVQFDPGMDFDHLAAGATATVTVSYTIEDEHGATSSSTVEVTVTGTNDGPVANADTAGGHENQTLTINVLVNDTDVDDGAVLTVTSASAPAGQGTASVVGNQVQFDPGTDFDNLAAGATEVVTVSYSIADEHGATSSSTVTVTVTGTNDGPVAVADTASGTENQVLTVDVLANDTDVDDGHAFTLLSASASAGTATVVGNQVQFDPGTDFDHLAAGATATATVSYTMEDEHGAQSSSTLTITVTGTNDGPVASADSATTSENAAVLVDVLANDDDVDNGAVLTVTAASAPPGQGTASIVSNQVQFDPGTDFDHLKVGATAVVVVTYAIADEHGATSNSTVTITVTGTNDGPVAVVDTAAGTENQVLTVDVLANDTDADDDHVLTVLSATAPSGQGTASVVGNQVQFDPGTDFDHLADGATTTVEIAYTIEDEHGAQSSSTLTITVTGTNDGPVANPDVGSAGENEGKAFAVVANDTDADDGAVLTLSSIDGVIVGGNPASPAEAGAFGIVGNTIQFTPGSAFDHLGVGENATVVVSYTVVDQHGAASSSTLTLTVTGANDAPALTGAQFAFADGTEDTAYTVTEAELLQGFTDVDGDTLSVSTLTAVNGTVVDNNDGTYTVTPTANFAGTVTLNYNVIDGNGGSVAASNGVFFESVNDPATFDGTFSGSVIEATSSNPGTPTATGNVTFEDVDELNLFFQQVTVPQASTGGYGSFTLTQTGTWTYTLNNANPTVDALNNGGTLNDSFIIRSADGTEQVISITINGATDFNYVSPTVFTGTGDPNDFDALGNPLGQTLPGGNGNDTIYGGAGADIITGGNGDDIIYGGSGGDSLDGGTQGDQLYGGSGNDTITGGNQNDRLIGGYGADTLDGGNGSDTFVYLSSLDTGDTINGFVAGADDIDLTAFAPNSFVGAITQAGAVGPNQVGYMFAGGVTTIYVDTNGVFGADLEIKLTGNIALTVNDFILGP